MPKIKLDTGNIIEVEESFFNLDDLQQQAFLKNVVSEIETTQKEPQINLTKEKALKIAYERNLITPEQKKAYEIALNRGLIKDEEQKPEIKYAPPPEKTWRDYSGETVIGLSIMILFSLFYIYSIVKKKEISGWRRLFLVMVVIPGTVFMFNDYYEFSVFLAVLYCFIYGVVWTIQGFRKK